MNQKTNEAGKMSGTRFDRLLATVIEGLGEYYPILQEQRDLLKSRVQSSYQDTGNDQADYEHLRDAVEKEAGKLLQSSEDWRSTLAVGDEVFWTDPNDGTCSGYRVITEIVSDSGTIESDETVVGLNDHGRVTEAYAGELSPLKPAEAAKLPATKCDPLDLLTRLVKWADVMGGWEAPVWQEAVDFVSARQATPEMPGGQPRVIKLDAFDIVVTVLPEGGTQITSSMHDSNEPEAMATALNGVELMIQAHAEAGVDINSPAYLQGIETSVEIIWSRFPTVALAPRVESPSRRM